MAGYDGDTTADDAISEEHRHLRAVWEQLRKEGLKQTQVGERIVSLQRKLGDQVIVDVSNSYLSQILVRPKKMPKSGEKQPTTARLRAVTLALADLVDRHRDELSTDRLLTVTDDLEQAMYLLQVELPLWQEGEAPLAASAMNRIHRAADEALDEQINQFQRPLCISVFGPPRVGKTTMLNVAQARASRLGYRVLHADVAEQLLASPDEAAFWSGMAFRFGLAGTIVEGQAFQKALFDTMAMDRRRVLLLLDGSNALLEGDDDSWTERALGHLTRFLIQAARTAPAGSPTKRITIVSAQTFQPTQLPKPSLQSMRILQDRSITVGPLEPAEVEHLLDLHIAQAQERGNVEVEGFASDIEDQRTVARHLVRWFGGHPMLCQDFLASWVTNPTVVDIEQRLAVPTDSAKQFVADLAQQVATDERVKVCIATATDNTPAESNYRVRAEALQVMGLIDDGAWSAPYLEAWLAPLLPRVDS